MSFTAVYGLFALMSIVSFNALILLSRFVRQIKEPPNDADYDLLIAQKKQLESEYEAKKNELFDSEDRMKKLEEKLQKTEDTLQAKLTEVNQLKAQSAQGAAPTGAQ